MSIAAEGRSDWPSVAALAGPLVERLVADARALRLGVHRGPGDARIVDAGIAAPGGIEAGRRIAEICLGGLGSVAIDADAGIARWPVSVTSRSSHPVLACLGSQYAGWNLSVDTYHAMGSGPGRALAAREKLFEELAYRDAADAAVLVMETDKEPPPALVEKVARDCAVRPERVTLILTPTKSLAGTVQIAARCLEVALHKAHALGFPLDRVVDGWASAPLPPPARDFVGAMGRTNDAILYGGRAHLFVRGDGAAAQSLAERLPSSASRDYGKTFASIFKACKGDFFAIDPMLFSPAAVTVTALDSGRSFHAGAIDRAMIDESFGG
ncbi:MAG: methenyltetrahydromethanopterin cyclohydrolase [Alphaproteobacteria bacterium]|nr:methenyltetrahydromethanopterin cyclohydrolase [Alphaproteobacteria bacterium]